MASTEKELIARELTPSFEILGNDVPQTPFVLSSPHSGRVYPEEFLRSSSLDAMSLRRSEDCFVDELFSDAAALGAALLAARFPRAYLDVNREPYELDPELIQEPLPDWANARSIRVAGGLGTIARIVADGQEIYKAPLSLEDALTRIECLHRPYHEALAGLIDRARQRFGYVILLDCHSMPSSQMARVSDARPDFVIGDRFGTSCDVGLSRYVKGALQAMGYGVQMNRPYAGGYITEHYGRPRRGVHAMQIEINRALYLDEKVLTKTSGFQVLQRDLKALMEKLFADAPLLIGRRAAAE